MSLAGPWTIWWAMGQHQRWGAQAYAVAWGVEAGHEPGWWPCSGRHPEGGQGRCLVNAFVDQLAFRLQGGLRKTKAATFA